MRVISFSAQKYYKAAYDAFFFVEDNKKALRYCDLAIMEDNKNIAALKLKAMILIYLDKPMQALESLLSANRLVEDDFEILSKIAFCYEQIGECSLAFEFCEKSAMCVSLGDWERMSSLYRLKIDLFLKVKRKTSAQKLLRNALKMLNNEEGQLLKQNYSYLDVGTSAIVVDFKQAKTAL